MSLSLYNNLECENKHCENSITIKNYNLKNMLFIIELYYNKSFTPCLLYTNLLYLGSTVQELVAVIKDATENIKNTDYPVAVIKSACELFLRFITLVGIDYGVCLIFFQYYQNFLIISYFWQSFRVLVSVKKGF